MNRAQDEAGAGALSSGALGGQCRKYRQTFNVPPGPVVELGIPWLSDALPYTRHL